MGAIVHELGKLSLNTLSPKFFLPQDLLDVFCTRMRQEIFPKCFTNKEQAIANEGDSCLVVMLTSHQYHLFGIYRRTLAIAARPLLLLLVQ